MVVHENLRANLRAYMSCSVSVVDMGKQVDICCLQNSLVYFLVLLYDLSRLHFDFIICLKRNGAKTPRLTCGYRYRRSHHLSQGSERFAFPVLNLLVNKDSSTSRIAFTGLPSNPQHRLHYYLLRVPIVMGAQSISS